MADKKVDDDAMAGNVDQIREIIFGGHIREYATRFAALEKSLKDAQARLRKDFEAQLKVLSDALEQEVADRRNADEGLDGLLQNQGGELGNELDATEKRLNQRADELSKALAAAQKALESEMTKQGNAFTRDLNKTNERLEENKVARDELAKLLTGVATSLSGDTSKKAKRK